MLHIWEQRNNMARLLAVFGVFAVTLAVIQCGVMAESSDLDEERYPPEDSADDRAASASAIAHASAQGGPNAYPYRYQQQPTPQVQSGVRCFTCTNCAHPTNFTASKLCPYSIDPMKNRKCVKVSEKYYHMKEPVVLRGCVTERGSCAEIKAALDTQKDVVKLLSCSECEGDLCNGAGQFTPNLATAILAMFVTPLLMKYTLS